MKGCLGCLGRLGAVGIRLALAFALIIVAVTVVRSAWYGVDSTPKRWTCAHLPTLCEHP